MVHRAMQLGNPYCLAIPSPRSKGTWNMVRLCESNGIKTHVFDGGLRIYCKKATT
jgi:hypothetical protein